MDPRAPPPVSPRGLSAFDAAVNRHVAMPGGGGARQLWRQDLLQWLSIEVPRRRGAATQDGQATALYGRVEWAWVLVFGANVRANPAARCRCLPLSPHAPCWMLPAQRDAAGQPTYSNMQEAWTICTRLWDAGLTLDYELSASGERLYIKVGAEHHILDNEASRDGGTGMLMRLTWTKGLAPYNAEFTDYYVERVNGTCFDSGARQRLVLKRIDRGILLPLIERMNLPKPEKLIAELRVRLRDTRVVRAQFLMELLTSVGAYQSDAEVLGYFGPNTLKAAQLSKFDHFFTVYPSEDMAQGPDAINSHNAQALDEAVEFARDEIKEIGKLTMKVVRASQGKKRVHVGKKEMERRMKEKLKEQGLEPLTYEECEHILVEIERWYQTGGQHAKFTGSLLTYFPIHDPDELRFFVSRWAKTDLITRLYVVGKTNEGKYTEGAYYSDEHKKKNQWAFKYQPIDEIRDYFGDALAMYFCWVGTYTDSLVWPAFIGIVCTLANWKDGEIDPDRSQYTNVYTFYFACWAVNFLGRWERRENELRFLWGNETMNEVKKPRPEYIGILRVNWVTGRETLVAISPAMQYFKRAVSWILILFIVVLTTFLALAAESLALLGPSGKKSCVHPSDPVLNATFCHSHDLSGKWACEAVATFDFAPTPELKSSLGSCEFSVQQLPHNNVMDMVNNYGWLIAGATGNLIVMFAGESVFYALARKLNDWENHRLQSDYQDALVYKNFVFQFVSNYFIMFYIAYLRQIEYPIVNITGDVCDMSCLNALQFKMFFIFTGKTYGLKIKEYGFPMLHRFCAARQDDKLAKTVSAQYQPDDSSKDNEEEESDEDRMKAILALDNQMHLSESEGTFEDFLTMVIQFGFLALFAPACPLAPALALVNNVIEIRMDAWKVCTLYRRPVWQRCDTIGAWNTVSKVLALIAVLTNATMICFVGSRMAGFPCTETCVGHVCRCTTARAIKETESIMERIQSTQLWILVVVIEHALVCLKAFLASVAPTQPRWVDEAKEVLEVRKSQMKTKDELNLLSLEVYRKDKNGAAELFDQLDTDGSGFLDSEELRQLLKKMGIDLEHGDVMKIMHEMDASGDGRVGFREFDAWWADNGDKNQYQLRDPEAVFRQIDVDGSGSLDREELRQLLKKLGQTKIKDQHITELMDELDVDGDGEVSYEEFEQWWRRNGGKKYKTRKERKEEEAELGRSRAEPTATGIKGRLQRQKSKLIDRMTDDADDSAAIHRTSKGAALIHTLHNNDPVDSPTGSPVQTPSDTSFWNPLLDETDADPSTGDLQPSRVFSIRFSEKKPLGLGLAEQYYHDKAGTSHRVVRVLKIAKGQCAAQYTGAGLRKGVIIQTIGGQRTEQLTMSQIYELLRPDHRPTEISFAEFADTPGANSLTHGDTSDFKAAGAAAAVAHKLGGRFGAHAIRGAAPLFAHANGGTRLSTASNSPLARPPQPPARPVHGNLVGRNIDPAVGAAGSHPAWRGAPPQFEIERPLPDPASRSATTKEFSKASPAMMASSLQRPPAQVISTTPRATKMATPPAFDRRQLVRGRSDEL